MSLGARVRALRLQRGIAQNDLAKRCGIRAHTLWRIEAGKHKGARSHVVQALARELSVSADWLLSGDPLSSSASSS